MLTLRYEDFEDIDNQKVVYCFAKKELKKVISISDELNNQVIELKKFKLNLDKYKERSFTTPTGRVIEGHFD